MDRLRIAMLLAGLLLAAAGCGDRGPALIGHLPLDEPGEIQDLDAEVNADASTSADGNGSLVIMAAGTELVRLATYETPDFGGDAVEVSGHLRLEMIPRPVAVDVWIDPVDDEPRLVRSMLPDFRRTIDWTPFTVRADLKPGEVPEKVRVALYIRGPGRVWMDDFTVRSVPGERKAD